jgi:phage tail-like protein
MPATRQDPFCAFRFTVALPGIGGGQVGGFSDVSGLGAETEVEPLREGGVNGFERHLAGPTRFSTRLVLKRGLGHPAHLWNWYVVVMSGAIVRLPLTITVQSEDRRQVQSWTFRDACPVKWTGPELHGAQSAVAFESIELVHRGLAMPGV